MTSEQAEEYVKWNQCTRHQLIVAHMALIVEIEHQRARIAGALGQPAHLPFDHLVTDAIRRLANR